MVGPTFFLQAFGGFLGLLILVALLRWTFSEGRSHDSRPGTKVYRRPLAWVIVGVQILFAIWLASGMRFYFVLPLWAVVNVILGVVWVGKRTCRDCGNTFKKALLDCPACQVRRSYANRAQDGRGS